MASVQQIIGKINPKAYAENGKELLKIYKSPENIPAEEVKPKPVTEHTLVYDSSSETLEPVYFFILDLMGEFGLTVEKYVDNFTSSPGSGHFSELGQRATVMQQQGSKLLGDVNTVLRSVLNIIYDLKEFKIRLQHYNDLNSKDNGVRDSALLGLKQIWMDKVDINKGNSSIKAMALGQAGFQTLIDAFLISKDDKDVKKLDLNDRVKRILIPRVQEFNIWVKQSEKELRKRYELERTYLRSQVNSLKLYSRWAKPYLEAASKLEMNNIGKEREPSLVKVFNTMLLELTLLGKDKIKIKDESLLGNLPSDYSKDSFLKTLKRDFYGAVLIDFKFRGIPQRVIQQSHYAFGGRVEVTFRAYALNDDELAQINAELANSDVEDVLKLIEGSTTESADQLREDINSFLDDEDQTQNSSSQNNANPFLALVGHYETPKKTVKQENSKSNVTLKKDDWIEANVIRPFTEEKAKETAFNLFDIYKKAHGMVSYT